MISNDMSPCPDVCVTRFGAILSPYIGSLAPLTGLAWAPMAVFAVAGLLSGLLTLALPETRGKALPRTLEEAVSLSSNTLPLEEEE